MLWHKARSGTEGAFSIALIVTGIFIGPAILLLATRVTTATEEAMRKWKAAGSPAS